MRGHRDQQASVGVLSLLAGMAVGIAIRNELEGFALTVILIAAVLYGIHGCLTSRGRHRVGRLTIGEVLVGLAILTTVLIAALSVPASGRGTHGGIVLVLSVSAAVYAVFFREPVERKG